MGQLRTANKRHKRAVASAVNALKTVAIEPAPTAKPAKKAK